MKHILTILILLVAGSVLAQFPDNPRKQKLGFQTTGEGLIYYGDGGPTYTPDGENGAYHYYDTTLNIFFVYDRINSEWDTVQAGGGGAGLVEWEDILGIPTLLDLDSTDNVEWADTSTAIVTLSRLTDSLATVTITETDPQWTADSSTYAAKSLLADTASAIRADFPTDTDTQLSQEQVEDFAGDLFMGNTETRISSVYNDAAGKVTLTVEDDLSQYDNTTADFVSGSELADTAAAIRADFPTGFSGAWGDLTGIPALLDLDSTDNVEWTDTTSVIVTATTLADTSGAVRDDIINSAAFTGTTTKTLTLTTPNGDITAQFTDATGAPGTSDGVVDGASLSNDSLVLTRTESLGTLRVDLSSFNTDTTFIQSEISDSIATITTFSGSWNDLSDVPANIDTDATDDFDGAFSSLSGIPTGLSDGDDDTQLNESQVEAFIDGDETSFDGWDKDASDDFSGAYGDLTGVPTDIDTDATDDINWSDTTSLISTLTNLADSTAAVRADFPDVSSFIDTEADPVWISDSSDYTLKTVLADTAAAIRADFPSGGGSDGVLDSVIFRNDTLLYVTSIDDTIRFSLDTLTRVAGYGLIDDGDTLRVDTTVIGGGGLSQVTSDATLSGLGTGGNPLKVDTTVIAPKDWVSTRGYITSPDDADSDPANEGRFAVAELFGKAAVTTNTQGALAITLPAGFGINTVVTSAANGGEIEFVADTADLATLVALKDTAAAIRADFPSGGGDVSFSDTTSTIATVTALNDSLDARIYFDSTQVGSSFSIDFENAERGVQMLDLNAQASATLSSVSNVPAGALFTLWITNANGSGTTLTLPSSFVQADGTAITSNEVSVNSGDRITILYNDTSSLYYTTILE